MDKGNLMKKGNKSPVKGKLPIIFTVVFLIIAALIVINGREKEKKEAEERTEKAETVAKSGISEDADEDAVYEFLQMNPKTNRTVIYTFSIYKNGNGDDVGTITADGDGHYYSILCSVDKQDDAQTFVFSSYNEDSEELADTQVGDILAVLHKKNKAVEWRKLKPLISGELPFPNY